MIPRFYAVVVLFDGTSAKKVLLGPKERKQAKLAAINAKQAKRSVFSGGNSVVLLILFWGGWTGKNFYGIQTPAL